MRSDWIRVGPKANDRCFYKGEESKIWTQRSVMGRNLCKDKAEIKVMEATNQRFPGPFQKPGRSKKAFFPTVSAGAMALPTP